MLILVTLLKDDEERHIHVEEEEDQGPVMPALMSGMEDSHKALVPLSENHLDTLSFSFGILVKL